MRAFRSLMTVLAFGGMGLMVLAQGGPFRTTGRYEAFFDWIDGLILSFGPTVVGYGLIGFGIAFAALWMAVGTNR